MPLLIINNLAINWIKKVGTSAILAAAAIPCREQLGHNGNMYCFRAFFLVLLMFCSITFAVESDPVIDAAERHVRMQTQGLPGKVSIRMSKFDSSRLSPCAIHEAFTPPGARMLGKTSVGVRCLGPNSWNVLVPVDISVTGSYVTTARAILAGQIIQAGDLHVLSGDISTLPTGIIAEPATALGKTVRNSLGAGQLLRSDQLIAPMVIRQGQLVRVISKGNGFSVSAEGKAITNASEGQLVQIRMNSGQTISGPARADGSVEISN
jgi:flagella basal body P-ring formation protein FlgA